MTAEIVDRISLDTIIAARPARIYYGAVTCWWTHDPDHVGTMDGTADGLLCDPQGGVLLETDQVLSFFRHVEKNIQGGHYGRHALRAFVAAHHLNCVVAGDGQQSTCFKDWPEYNVALDEQDRRDRAREFRRPIVTMKLPESW